MGLETNVGDVSSIKGYKTNDKIWILRECYVYCLYLTEYGLKANIRCGFPVVPSSNHSRDRKWFWLGAISPAYVSFMVHINLSKRTCKWQRCVSRLVIQEIKGRPTSIKRKIWALCCPCSEDNNHPLGVITHNSLVKNCNINCSMP
jgi:hypothetical protein